MAPALNRYFDDPELTDAERQRAQGHRGGVLWLTGLSGAGKTTLAIGLERRLFEQGMRVIVLDGDNVRHGLNADLGFSPEDRAENIRRIGEVAALYADAGLIVITAFISPYLEDRDQARAAAGDGFHEVYLSTSLADCEGRDAKGLYTKARRGEIPEFTGISAPYEAPPAAELTIDTGAESLDESLTKLTDYVRVAFSIVSDG